MYFYKAFGLIISSEIECPELSPVEEQEYNVLIKFNKLPNQLDNVVFTSPRIQTNKDSLLLKVDNIAKYHIKNGKEIYIDKYNGIDEDSVRIFLLGSAFGALLHQRGTLIFHGSAIKNGNESILFLGDSGVGKSTLASTFLKRGYQILADDVCAIAFDDNKVPHVIPAFPQIKIWEDTLNKLDIDFANLRKVRPEMQKYALPLDDDFCENKLPLQKIYIISTHNKAETEIKHIEGKNKFKDLVYHVYRKRFIEVFNAKLPFYENCTLLSSAVSIVRVTRPNMSENPNELADFIENDFKSTTVV